VDSIVLRAEITPTAKSVVTNKANEIKIVVSTSATDTFFFFFCLTAGA